MREALLGPMLEQELSKSKTYRFKTALEAEFFMKVCFNKAMEKCNVFAPPKNIDAAQREIALNKLMTANKVKVEWSKQVLLGEWRKTIFIYKNGELMAFITEPVMKRPSAISTEKYPAWTIRTNVKVC